MKACRVLIAGLALLAADLLGILAGFLAYKTMRPANQLAVQLPVAAALSVLFYLAWVLALRIRPFGGLHLGSAAEAVWALAASLLWGPAVFVPLHLLTQGYLSSAGNIVGLLAFQVPVNTVILLATRPAMPRQSSTGEPRPR